MRAHIRQMTESDSLRAALDWTVFGIGAVSLTVAIAATVLNHAAQTSSDAPRSESTLSAG